MLTEDSPISSAAAANNYARFIAFTPQECDSPTENASRSKSVADTPAFL
jgi:hypothetical protein